MEFQFRKIRPLYDDMKRIGKFQEKFEFPIHGSNDIIVYFEVIFLIDRAPFELLIGARGYTLAFILQVKSGFRTELSDEIYYQICEILNLNYSKNHFSSAKFLDTLDCAAPTHCSPLRVQPHEVAYYKKREIPECEKIYFLGWNDHQLDGRTARNFQKTRELLGDAVADFCEKNNISSLWTDIPNERKDYCTPPGFIS